MNQEVKQINNKKVKKTVVFFPICRFFGFFLTSVSACAY